MSKILKRYDKDPSAEVLERCLSKDTIKRHKSLQRIINLLCEIEGSYTLFVDGAWGSGKTYAIKQIVELLRHKNSFLVTELDGAILDDFCQSVGIGSLSKTLIPVYFNAWDHDYYDDPLCPLLCEMAVQLDGSAVMRDRNYKKAILEVLDSVLPISLGSAIDNLCGEDVLKGFKDRLELRAKFDVLVNEALVSEGERLVLFIDELDRCKPEFAIRFLEQTKRLFNNSRVIVVVSTDSVQLGNALGGVYGESFDAKKYLERFYDMKIELNKIHPMEYLELLGYVDHGYRGFEMVVYSLVWNKELSMRDLQKIAPTLIDARRFASSHFSSYSAAVSFATNGLMPGFIVIAYSDPDLWRAIKDANRYGLAYEYLKDIDGFHDLMCYALSGFKNDYEDVSEADCRQFVFDVCTSLFADRELDRSVREAHERLGAGCDLRCLRKQVVDFDFS